MYLTRREPKETGREYALRTLKDNIIRLELPPGAMVSENELATQMGLSRTPVREALVELSKVEIVEIYPQRGSAIARIDYDLVEEARFMRLVLEKAVVEQVCGLAGPEDILRLRRILEIYARQMVDGDSDGGLNTDNLFHRALFQIARKDRVYGLIRNMSIHFDRVRRLSLSAGTDTHVMEDHAAIVDAIEAGDAPRAAALMERHLTRYRCEEKILRKTYPDYFKPQGETPYAHP